MEQPDDAGTPAEQSFEAFFAQENAAERAPAAAVSESKTDAVAPPEAPPEKEPIAAKEGESSDRNLDGTFKPKEKKPRNDPQARIDQQTERQRAAERRAEAAERRLSELEATLRRPQAPPQAPIVPAVAETPQAAWKRYMAHPDAPKRESFEDPTDYAIAANYFISEQRDTERNAREQQMLGQQLDAQRANAFRERGIAKDPKFFENLQSRIMAEGDPPINRPTQDYIKASPLGPDLLVYLLDNPADAQRLSTLPPLESREAIAEIAGLLKARQTAASQAPRPTPVLSRAPAPIQPLGGSLTPADTASDDVSFEEFYRRENAKTQRR